MQTTTNTTKIIIGVVVLILIGLAVYMTSSSDGMLRTDQVATTTATSTGAVQGSSVTNGTGKTGTVANGSMTVKPGQVMTVNPKKNPLAGTSWIWKDTSFNNKSAAVIPGNTKFVITFGTDGAVTSTTDCNSVSGRYAVNNDKINITSTVSTRMACADATLESTYVQQLTQITNYTFESLNELDLTTVNGSATMSFSRR